MPTRDLTGRAALITGGGTGIGRGIALALARRGAPVALCGRRAEPLRAVAAEVQALGVQAAVVPGDITDSAARPAVLAAAHAALGPIHILVHNAGVLAGGALFQLNAEEIEQALAVNLLAPIDLTRLALPDLMLTHGAVVCVGSTMSRVPMPHAAVYSATKGGLHGFCAALRYELAPYGVHLLEAYPPTVATAMTATMGQRAAEGLPPWLPRRLATRFLHGEAPEAAGERIVAALAAGKQEIAWGAGERWLQRLHAAAPRLTANLIAAQRRQFAQALTPETKAGTVSKTLDLHAQLAAVRAAYPTQAAVIEGHTWTYLDTVHGGDDVLLLLPGGMGAADTSFQYIGAFAPRFRVVSLDYPPTLDQLPPLLAGPAQLLARLGIDRAHVVGGSYSGLVAQHLASAQPQVVASLLLSNTPAPDTAQAASWRRRAAAAALLPEGLVHGIMRSLVRGFLRGDSPAEQFWRAYFAAAIPHLSKQAMLTRLRLTGAMHAAARELEAAPYLGPALIIAAAHDAMVSPAEQAALRRRYPQAEHIVIPQSGHTSSLDDPQTYISIYREFLCRHSPLPGR